MSKKKKPPMPGLSKGKHGVLEEAGVAFDPAGQHVDLTKDEKRRTTALMMAIQAYNNLIIKEAAYLKEMIDQSRREDGIKLKPATIDAMVEAAIKFDIFIAGELTEPDDGPTHGGAQTEEQPTQESDAETGEP